MTSNEWKQAWGIDRLIYGSDDIAALPDNIAKFINTYGVPWRVIFEAEDMSFEISFEPLSHPLECYNQTISWGDFYKADIDRSWSEQLVIASEDFCNGSASYCIHRTKGTIVRLDVELNEPESFVNSSLEQFCNSLLLTVQWSSKNRNQTPLQWITTLAELEDRMTKLDAQAFANHNSLWPQLMAWLKGSKPGSIEITTDPQKSKPRF